MTDAPARRVLFVCRLNRMRSATAERIFSKRPDLDVRSAGTSEDALTRVNAQMLDWADLIFIMDDQQRRALDRLFAGHPALEQLICACVAGPSSPVVPCVPVPATVVMTPAGSIRRTRWLRVSAT